MQHSLLCRTIASSQWRSLSLYLARRRIYSSRAIDSQTKPTKPTTDPTKPSDDKPKAAAAAAAASAAASTTRTSINSQNDNADSVKIRTYVNSPRAKKVGASNGAGARRKGRKHIENKVEPQQGKRNDNDGKKEDLPLDVELVARTLLARGRADTAGVKRLSEKLRNEVNTKKKERKGEVEHGVYRPLRRRSGGEDMRLQLKAKSDDSRDQKSGRLSIWPSRSELKSLLDEIFPSDDITDSAGSAKYNEPTEMPRLKLEHLITDEEYRPKTAEQSEEETLRRFYEAEREHLGKEKGILLFRGLGPSLEEEDFRRLSPKGKHIEGWEHELGNILKVIPGRDLDTMERNGTYYLLFESPGSAMTYKEEVERRHALSRMYRPHDISSPIPPPPGYLIEGEDVHALVEGFTLVPPRQKLLIMPIHEPFDDLVQSLVDHGGYKALQPGQQKQAQVGDRDHIPEEPRTKVLVSVDGPVLPYIAIMEGIRLDGKSRGWHWNTIERHSVMKLDFTGWRGVVPGNYKTPGNNAELLRRRNRWTVKFATESEAKRFARAWHCTRLPSKESIHDTGIEGPLVSAEVVW